MANFDRHAERTELFELALLDRAPESEGIDLKAVRLYRLNRLRDQMAKYGLDAAILSDSVNIRYATGARNMQVFTMRNPPTRYFILTADRPILFEFTGCLHLAKGYETVNEVHPAGSVTFTGTGPNIEEKERTWAAEMVDLITELVGKRGTTLGLERTTTNVAISLRDHGLNIVDTQKSIEMARTVKPPEQIKCITASLQAIGGAVGKIRDAVRPGLTKNELWSVMHKSVIEQNDDFVETRLLSAGPYTNPWFQESPDPPSDEQRELYKATYEQVHHNMGILKPGLTFRGDMPEQYWANQYFLSAHMCGLTGEYPYLYHRGDFPDASYDGVIETDMVLCVESYIGKEGGTRGVRLEQQVLVTETGIELLSKFPFEEALLK